MSLPSLLPLLALVALAPAAPQADADDVAYFEASVRPLLAERCATCHGGDSPKGELDLSEVASIRRAIDEIELVVPGSPEPGGLLLDAIGYEDPFTAMPPDGKLEDAELAVLREWVRRGAPLPAADMERAASAFDLEGRRAAHWAWQPMADPEPPATSLAWRARDPLDLFLLAALEASGLEPAKEAPRAVWLRRASFALTGLPPTPADLAAFEADSAPGAFERAADRLLASPHYGERWARHWLDLVRYAETKAHEFDFVIPNAWQYRDYVVRAFDADVPYDRFVREHIAGDLLAEDALHGPRLDPTGTFDESVLGTGWWWLHEDVHSPVDTRKDETDRLANQVDTLSKSVLGLTVACARCHDHKFDAISAEDYHALTGFPLSTGYRQVRYESELVNRGVERDLAALHARHDRTVRSAVAGFLTAFADDLEAAAPALVALGEQRAEPSAAVRTVQRAPRPGDAPLPAWADLLVEDFEDPRPFAEAGAWQVEGEAFRPRPITRDDLPGWQAVTGFRGERFLNSHGGLDDPADSAAGDALHGRVTSPPFALERRYLHVLVSGGDHEATAVEVVVDGDVVAAVRGASSNRFEPRRLDLERWRGREARLVARDDQEGGWGHIGLDHVVLSDAPDAGALARARRAADWRAELSRATELAGGSAADGAALLALDDLLQRAANHGAWHPGWWAARAIAEGPAALPALEAAAVEALDAADVPRPPAVVDYADADTPWITNGPAFGLGPLESGAVSPGDVAARPRVAALPAASADPFWSGLVSAHGVERHQGTLDYVQAGRTLVTPTFRIEGGHLFHLVRGKGRVFASCDSHRMLSGPLWTESVKSLDTRGRWRWVHHDLTRLVGAMARLEFTAEEGALDLEVAATVDRPDALTPRSPLDGAGFGARLLDEGPGDPAAVVRLAAAAVRDAAHLVREGGVPGRALEDAERAALAATADALLADLDAQRRLDALRAQLAPAHADLAELQKNVVRRSALAPAALELEGRDERVLRRGDAGSPMDPAPRRDLAATRADDLPLATPGAGSGRLALADSWLGGEHPLVARVWVNRLWHHVFGRGLVATVDDLGATGAAPSHPELLDRLARDLVESGWSTRAMLRRFVLSDAFRRSSASPARASDLDPLNTLLSHANVRRLEAEAVRDAMLVATGELDATRFGPPVPVHLTPFMHGRGRPSSGPIDGGRRRSIYLSVRRNFLAPFMTVFDFPAPSGTRGARSVSNVPAQALTLANDPFVEGRAQAFAALVLRRGFPVAGRVDAMFLRTIGRAPTAAEREAAAAFVAEAASPLHGVTDLAQALFALQEFVWIR